MKLFMLANLLVSICNIQFINIMSPTHFTNCINQQILNRQIIMKERQIIEGLHTQSEVQPITVISLGKVGHAKPYFLISPNSSRGIPNLGPLNRYFSSDLSRTPRFKSDKTKRNKKSNIFFEDTYKINAWNDSFYHACKSLGTSPQKKKQKKQEIKNQSSFRMNDPHKLGQTVKNTQNSGPLLERKCFSEEKSQKNRKRVHQNQLFTKLKRAQAIRRKVEEDHNPYKQFHLYENSSKSYLLYPCASFGYGQDSNLELKQKYKNIQSFRNSSNGISSKYNNIFFKDKKKFCLNLETPRCSQKLIIH